MRIKVKVKDIELEVNDNNNNTVINYEWHNNEVQGAFSNNICSKTIKVMCEEAMKLLKEQMLNVKIK
jgi:hypothetical protein